VVTKKHEDMKITSIIVEDEKAASDALQSYLQKYCPNIEVVALAIDARSAVELIREHNPQLVFLDVELPFGNAFDVLEQTNDLLFETIFVTAFSEYSLKALNQSAAYYLLKPVSIEDLITAVSKVTEQIENKINFDRNKIILENFREQQWEKKQVIIPTIEGFEVIRAEQIFRLQGNGNFTDIHLIDGTKKMACRFLKHYDEALSFPFVRVHKSHIINIHHIKSYHKGHGGYVVLIDGSEVFISANYKEAFLKLF
jgi:two-component system, LytTR family, response regulator